MRLKTPGLLALGATLWVCAHAYAASPDASAHDYEIAANDGYGLEDCLAGGAECGHVVADAWCEAHGHGHALTFGLKSEIEGGATKVAATDEPYVIRCGD